MKRKDSPKKDEVWSGDYESWQSASASTGGYDKKEILDKVKSAVLKVKGGEASYERDSILFYDNAYHHQLVKLLNEISDRKGLSIIDFGGSLGSTYFQNRKHLVASKCSWMVVEQEHFVKAGKEGIETEELKFFSNIEEALKHSPSRIILLSSVLPYLSDPYDWIKKIKSYNFDFIIIDRNAFIEGERDILTVQKVPESIYKASYPAWFFNEDKFVKAFADNYEKKIEFMNEVSEPTLVNNKQAWWKGFLFKRKNV